MSLQHECNIDNLNKQRLLKLKHAWQLVGFTGFTFNSSLLSTVVEALQVNAMHTEWYS